MGVGRATQQPSLLEKAVDDLTVISGQKPIITRAGNSIAGFKLREGQAIGTKVTLRGDRMSRIGKAPVNLPSGVEVSVAERTITVKGPKGTLSRELPGEIEVSVDGGVLTCTRPNDERRNRAQHGLTRSLVNNMLLVRYLQLKSKVDWAFSNLIYFLRMNLFIYRDLWEWLEKPFAPPDPIPLEPIAAQGAFSWR